MLPRLLKKQVEPKKRSTMKQTDLAWAAGIIDGEGSVCIIKEERPGNLSTQHRLRVAVGMTHKPTVQRLEDIFKVGHVRTTPNHLKGNNWKPVYEWVIYSNQAMAVLDKTENYMTTKKRHVKVARQFAERPRAKTGSGNKVPLAFLKQREKLYLRMRSLNIKGKR